MTQYPKTLRVQISAHYNAQADRVLGEELDFSSPDELRQHLAKHDHAPVDEAAIAAAKTYLEELDYEPAVGTR